MKSHPVSYSGSNDIPMKRGIFLSSFKFALSFLAFILLFTLVTLGMGLFFSSVTEEEALSDTDLIPSAFPVTVIDAGHGGEDGGASDNGLVEKDLNLDVALRLGALYEIAGLPYRLTREDDRLLYREKVKGTLKSQDLRTRLDIAEEYKDPVFVSLHMNRYPVEKYAGLQVWYSPNNRSSLLLAEAMQAAVKEHLQPDNSRGVKKAGSNIFLLNRLECPAVLAECGFLSNAEEAERLGDPAYRTSLSALLFSSLLPFVLGRTEA